MHETSSTLELLIELVRPRLSGKSRDWFENVLELARAAGQKARLLGAYSAASRKVGKQALDLTPEEKVRLESIRPNLSLDHWGLDEAVRAILLLASERAPADQHFQLIEQAYEYGDSREQESWLRALSLLPGGERFASTAIDACRTNIVPLFEAIACENPYPALHFPELNFNQMVLKALFNGITIARIVGLENRFNEELSRMANDYASELEAAGRKVPVDIWLVLVPRMPDEARDRVLKYIHHSDPDHRYWLAVGTRYAVDDSLRRELEQRRQEETDPRVLAALQSALAAGGPKGDKGA